MQRKHIRKKRIGQKVASSRNFFNILTQRSNIEIGNVNFDELTSDVK